MGISTGTKLNGRWTIGKQLGSGACAEVYSVQERDPETNCLLVVKCIPLPDPKSKKAAQKDQAKVADTLYQEHVYYTNGLLYGFGFVPKIPKGAYGQDAGHRYLVMEALDYDLMGLVASSSGRGRPTNAAIADIGLQILAGLKFIHGKGYVFVDVKPENFMMKHVSGKDKLHFIDFGVMEKLKSYMSGGVQRVAEHRDIVAGTPLFASLGVHRGGTPDRSDDLESMAYVLLSLTSPDCGLPWRGEHLCSETACLRAKEECDMDAYCRAQGCPQLGDIISLCRNTEYTVSPDYSRIQTLLEKLRSAKPPATTKRGRSSVGGKANGTLDGASADVLPTSQGSSVATGGRASSTRDRASRGQRAVTDVVIDLAEEEEDSFSELQPVKPAKKGRVSASKAKVSTTTTRPPPTPLRSIEGDDDDEPTMPTDAPAARGRRKITPAVVVDVVGDISSTTDMVLEILSGPYQGKTLRLPHVAASSASSSKAPVGKAKGRARGKSGRVLEDISSEMIAIGRMCDDIDAAVYLKLERDEYVSDSHAVIQVLSACNGMPSFRIKDLGSTNGTKVNRNKIAADSWVEGNIGDILRVGATNMKIIREQVSEVPVPKKIAKKR